MKYEVPVVATVIGRWTVVGQEARRLGALVGAGRVRRPSNSRTHFPPAASWLSPAFLSVDDLDA